MSHALLAVLGVYAVFTPSLFYGLWRHARPDYHKKLPVPGVLTDDTMVLTSDSDYVGLI